jgi:hypothetical protein
MESPHCTARCDPFMQMRSFWIQANHVTPSPTLFFPNVARWFILVNCACSLQITMPHELIFRDYLPNIRRLSCDHPCDSPCGSALIYAFSNRLMLRATLTAAESRGIQPAKTTYLIRTVYWHNSRCRRVGFVSQCSSHWSPRSGSR